MQTGPKVTFCILKDRRIPNMFALLLKVLRKLNIVGIFVVKDYIVCIL